MVEIIVLIFLTRIIGTLATKKGQKPGRWKLYTVIAWFVCEIFGIAISVLLSGNTNIFLLALVGWAFAFGGFLFVRYRLEKMPDVKNDWLDNIGKEQP